MEVETPELPGWPAAQHRLAALAAGLNAFFRFTRPHTMLGTLVSVCSISLLALVSRAGLGAGQVSVPLGQCSARCGWLGGCFAAAAGLLRFWCLSTQRT